MNLFLVLKFFYCNQLVSQLSVIYWYIVMLYIWFIVGSSQCYISLHWSVRKRADIHLATVRAEKIFHSSDAMLHVFVTSQYELGYWRHMTRCLVIYLTAELWGPSSLHAWSDNEIHASSHLSISHLSILPPIYQPPIQSSLLPPNYLSIPPSIHPFI